MRLFHASLVMKGNSFRQILLLAMALLALVAIVNRSSLPFVVILPSDSMLRVAGVDLLHQVRVILPDDVMISLRAAVMQAEIGRASLNSGDISQPATSYLYPILLTHFDSPEYPWVMPLVAITVGLVSLLGSVFLIHRVSMLGGGEVSLWWIFIALFNASVIQYAFSGWEHLPQAFFIVLSGACILFAEQQGENPSKSLLALAGVACALAFLFRADSVVLFLPWLAVGAWYVFVRSVRWLCFLVAAAFAAVVYLAYQWDIYGNLLPTTARLKAGAATDWSANAIYMATNFINGSAVAVTVLSALLLWRIRSVLTPMLYAMTASLVLFLAYGFFVSDVFPYARMFIPAAMLGILAACMATSLGLHSGGVASNVPERFFRISLILISIGALVTLAFDIGRTRVVQPTVRLVHPVVEHSVLADVLKQRLDPSYHSVGLFWLGAASYELRGFEIVDFLGKGDELIARSPVKWGPPGHNKWDISLSIKKWKPAVIIARHDVAIATSQVRQQALASHRPWAFWEALYENELVRDGYTYCRPSIAREFGLLIRRDLLGRFDDVCTFRGVK